MDAIKFEFRNIEHLSFEQSEESIYIKIWRQLRTDPFFGMKQPTPFGGFLGFEVKLLVRYEGLRADGYSFDLFRNDDKIQSGVTGPDGTFTGLKIDITYDEDQVDDYRLEVFEKINEEQQECNTRSEELYEPNRLVDTTAPIREAFE